MEQPCANFLLCGNLEPQWILNLNGGICQQPCALMYGCAFEFTEFAADEACPLCLETGLSAIVFQCGHKVCAQCYGRGTWCETAAHLFIYLHLCRYIVAINFFEINKKHGMIRRLRVVKEVSRMGFVLHMR
jgi:hypothetical protein